MRKFSRVISIGAVCQVAHQIEQRFGFRINNPFDWIVTPLASIDKIFSDDGAQFGKNVEIIGDTAVCEHYGVGYHHEFPRDEKQCPIINEKTLAACREKLRHKYERFLSTLSDGRPTLFIRMLGHFKTRALYVRDPDPVSIEDLNSLATSFARKFPALPFSIAYVYQREFTSNKFDRAGLDPRIHPFLLAHDPQDDWSGNTTSWVKLFQRFMFDMGRDEGIAERDSLVGPANRSYAGRATPAT